MVENTKIMTHGRLMTQFTRIGPYLRQNKSSEESYFFDCLSVCVDADKAPDKREFWGWWFELSVIKSGFEYVYEFGKYDKKGHWTQEEVPKDVKDEVQKTLEVFYAKLTAFLDESTELKLVPNALIKKQKRTL